MVIVRYKVYGRDGHRQKASFWPSTDFTVPGGTVCVYNSDQNFTNDYSEVYIASDSEAECDEILEGQLSDGYFENCYIGVVIKEVRL